MRPSTLSRPQVYSVVKIGSVSTDIPSICFTVSVKSHFLCISSQFFFQLSPHCFRILPFQRAIAIQSVLMTASLYKLLTNTSNNDFASCSWLLRKTVDGTIFFFSKVCTCSYCEPICNSNPSCSGPAWLFRTVRNPPV
jgi:hypothetical protein